MLEEKIEQLITTYPQYALLLHSLGIPFYQYQELSLQELCQAKKLEPQYVVRLLQETHLPSVTPIRKLKNTSLETLIGYLKHQHLFFLHKKMPFLMHIIEHLPEKNKLAGDLQLLFPLFVEDFIRHIHDEEDQLFFYILSLQKANKSRDLRKLYEITQKYSLQDFALAHDTHDDEMEGIRQLTQHYQIHEDFSLHLKVVYFHLQDFEKHLQQHAFIENEILFPKGLVLENAIKAKIKEESQWN